MVLCQSARWWQRLYKWATARNSNKWGSWNSERWTEELFELRSSSSKPGFLATVASWSSNSFGWQGSSTQLSNGTKLGESEPAPRTLIQNKLLYPQCCPWGQLAIRPAFHSPQGLEQWWNSFRRIFLLLKILKSFMKLRAVFLLSTHCSPPILVHPPTAPCPQGLGFSWPCRTLSTRFQQCPVKLQPPTLPGQGSDSMPVHLSTLVWVLSRKANTGYEFPFFLLYNTTEKVSV